MATPVLRGQVLAALILLAWLATLVIGLQIPWQHSPTGLVLLAVLVRTFLQTGLFIVGHDAMHGLLVPGSARANLRLGGLMLALYAALPYRACQRHHRRHHRSPAEAGDPDFHRPGAGSAWLWYGQFMARYLNPIQMGLLLGAWALLAWLNSIQAVLLVCTLPLLLSSLQLFIVGTYLPHRRSAADPSSVHEPVSLELPEWLSLLACFHFGYHREHHQAPDLAWHELPARRRANPTVALATAGSAL